MRNDGGGKRQPASPSFCRANSASVSFQIQLELDKYLPQVGSSLLSLSADGDKKYRRESASVVDDFFSEEKPTTPYSLNINVILPSTAHLRTGLYRPNSKSLAPQQIKTEPDLEVPCSVPTTTSTQALPDFTSVFNVHPVTSSVFIKPDLSAEAGVVSVPSGSQQQQPNLNGDLQIGPPAPQQQVYHMPIAGDLTMTLSHSSPSAGGRAMLTLGSGALPMTNGSYMMAEHHLPQHHGYYHASMTGSSQSTAPHSLPPSPPNSQPGSPDGQAELLSLASQPPPPYQQRLVKMTGLTPHALLMTHGQGVLTGPKYNRRNNPELEKRRIHFCDYPGDHMATPLKLGWSTRARRGSLFYRVDGCCRLAVVTRFPWRQQSSTRWEREPPLDRGPVGPARRRRIELNKTLLGGNLIEKRFSRS